MTIDSNIVNDTVTANISVRRYVGGKMHTRYISNITTTVDKLINDCKQDIAVNGKIKTDNMVIEHMTSNIIWLSDSLFDVRIELI